MLAIYDDIMDLQILTIFSSFSFCVWSRRYRGIWSFLTMTGIWTFYWFVPISSISSVLQCCTIWRSIQESIIFLQLTTMWRYSAAVCWLFCFWWYPQLILLWRYPVIIRGFWCVWRYHAFLDLSVFRRYISISFNIRPFLITRFPLSLSTTI